MKRTDRSKDYVALHWSTRALTSATAPRTWLSLQLPSPERTATELSAEFQEHCHRVTICTGSHTEDIHGGEERGTSPGWIMPKIGPVNTRKNVLLFIMTSAR